MATTCLVNVDFGPASVLGVGLITCGVALYNVRVRNPLISKDYDIFFSSLGLLTGGILVFQGWRLDPLLLFSQLLMTTVAVSFAAEAIQLRGTVAELEERAALADMNEAGASDAADVGVTAAARFSRRRQAVDGAASAAAAAAMGASAALPGSQSYDAESYLYGTDFGAAGAADDSAWTDPDAASADASAWGTVEAWDSATPSPPTVAAPTLEPSPEAVTDDDDDDDWEL